MENNYNKFLQLRKDYPDFIYRNYRIEDLETQYKIIYEFEIPKLAVFHPSIEIPKKEISSYDFFEYLVFHLGMVELISYFKCTCSPNVIIEAGYLNKEQIEWFQKLYFDGLGEFLYCNGIEIEEADLLHINCIASEKKISIPEFEGIGNIIPIGGGKDSIVSIELLREEYENNTCFIMNPKNTTLDCVKMGNYTKEKLITVRRNLDYKIIELNQQGFLNGHTPFSALLAFLTYIVAYLNKKRYIVLSNESSANEATVIGTNINHQYSKSFEFENDFNDYTKKYFGIEIQYFSLLRPLNELQIGKLFSNYKKYHPIFKSCNQGSKKEVWNWCCECPKCLFVYIILSPYLTQEELVEIFGVNIFEKKELLPTFLQLLGYSETKPFDCIGTIREVKYAVSITIYNWNKTKLPYLLAYYKEHFPLYLEDNPELDYNINHNLDNHFEEIIKKELRCDDDTRDN